METPKTKFYFIYILGIILFLTSCDPAHNGKTFIRNESSFTLELKYKTHINDTLIIIPPFSLVDILHFGGIGAGRDYDCCACEWVEISLQPTNTSKSLTKSITDNKNWTITNPNKKRFSNEEIDCEFSILETDLQ